MDQDKIQLRSTDVFLPRDLRMILIGLYFTLAVDAFVGIMCLCSNLQEHQEVVKVIS